MGLESPQSLQDDALPLAPPSSCCPAGASPELTQMCYGVVHQEAYTLSLSCSNTHARAYTPIFKQSHCTKESKHTNPPCLYTPILRLKATRYPANTHVGVLSYTTAHPLTHTQVRVQDPHAEMPTLRWADLHTSGCTGSYMDTAKLLSRLRVRTQ